MKQLILPLVLALFLPLTAQGFEFADKAEWHFKRLDTNHDNVVSEKEYMHTVKVRFDGIDTNSDGVLSSDEMRAHWQTKQRKMEKYLNEENGEHDRD
ncbi:MAG: hypothetical protein ACE5F3_04135 [Mariprofundaceae bacterium]